jgi:hypothetical protein
MVIDAHSQNIIREEVLDRYDIFDLVNLLNLQLSELYPYIEDIILDNVELLDLHIAETLSSDADGEDEDDETQP